MRGVFADAMAPWGKFLDMIASATNARNQGVGSTKLTDT